jgi:hypothetical protein
MREVCFGPLGLFRSNREEKQVLVATNSCRGASGNGSAAAASVARDVDAGGELERGAELGSSVPLGRGILRSAQQGSGSGGLIQ